MSHLYLPYTYTIVTLVMALSNAVSDSAFASICYAVFIQTQAQP